MNPALSKMVNLNNPIGMRLVDPTFHTGPDSLTEASRESAALFKARMLEHKYHDSLNALELPENGSTAKVHFRVGGRTDEEGKPLPSSVFMVKPYYENLNHWQYGHYPISGWAEMAYQGILKAAGMEPLAMRVHAFPYEGSALLGVELEPDMHPVGYTLGPEFHQRPWDPVTQTGKVDFSHITKDYAARLGALDFLLNNQDRNLHNLMMRVDEEGECNDLLAIDNGLSMQYLESNRFTNDKSRDSLFHYLRAPAFRPILTHTGGAVRAIASWWKDRKPQIVREATKHINGIQHPELAKHMMDSFDDRADALDRVTRDYEEHGGKPYTDYTSGYINNVNKPLYARSSVKVRSWKPVNDPHPFPGEDEPLFDKERQSP